MTQRRVREARIEPHETCVFAEARDLLFRESTRRALRANRNARSVEVSAVMIIAFMGIVAAIVLLLLTPAEREPVRTKPTEPTPWLRALLLGAACFGLLGIMVVLSGGAPWLVDGHAVASLDETATSRLGNMVAAHASALGHGDSWTRNALLQQTFGAAMLAAFAVVQRNRRR